NYLYNYSKDLNISKNVGVKFPEKGNFGEWISGKHFRFKISKGKINFNPEDTYSFVLTNLDVATARVKSNISVAPMSKGSSIIRFSKSAYSQQEAIEVVNNSLELLRESELEEKNLIAKNTLKYIGEQIGIVKEKVDSASIEFQNLQKREKIYDFGGEKGEILANVKTLEKQRIEYQEKINALNSVSNNVHQAGSKGMIDLQIVGLSEGNFSSEVSKLRAMELERENLRLLYKSE